VRLWVLVVLVVGCYHPTPPEGAPCSATEPCPSGQTCDERLSPPRCVSQLGDLDAASDTAADAAIDAPVTSCSSSVDCLDPNNPVCNVASGVCKPCTADSQCGSGFCSESQGTCIATANALFVAEAPTGNDANTCTSAASPCATISGALGKLTATRRSIRVAGGSYNESIVLATSNPVLISGPDTSPDVVLNYAITGFGTGTHDHAIESTGTDLTIEGLVIQGAPNEALRASTKLTVFASLIRNNVGGIDCRGCTLLVVDSFVRDNVSAGTEIGIAASQASASVTIKRSKVQGHGGAGISLGTASYTIINSWITVNGTGITLTTPGATHVFDFNTVASNTASGAECTNAAALSNSIFANNGSALAGACTATFSLFTGAVPGGTGNVSGSAGFVSTDDFHITSASNARGKADSNANVTTDIDGEPRPQGDYDIGADEIP